MRFQQSTLTLVALAGFLLPFTAMAQGVAQAMFINTSGNVGIGTTDPSARLHVAGDARVTGSLQVNGRLGIGNTAPRQALDVSGSAVVERDLQVGGALTLGRVPIAFQTAGGNALRVDSRIWDQSGVVTPVGAVIPYAGTTAPDGWLLCDGSPIPQDAKYDELRRVLGRGPDARTPDMRGLFVVGHNPQGTMNPGRRANNLLDTGGSDAIIIGEAHLPAHNHTMNNGSIATEKGALKMVGLNQRWYFHDQGNGGHRTGGTGGRQPIDARPPFVALNYIIKY